MPRYIILRKSGVHRAACFALYRALLRQKRQLHLNEHQQHLFRKQIWAVFKRNTKLQSPPQISTALQLGYETLEGLHDGRRQQRVLDHIFGLESIPESNARLEKPPSSNQANTIRADKAPKIQAAPSPGGARTLDRPYQNLSGRRHVPTLVNANRVPFLRIKKPQLPFMNRIIRNIVRTRNHRILDGARLDNELPFAQDEEEWDRILYELAGLDSTNLLEPRWHHEVKQAIHDNHQRQVGAIQKRADLSAQLQAIVEKEKVLAQEEKLRTRDEKHKAYKARRLARKGLGDSEIQKGLDSQMEKAVIDALTMIEDVRNQDQQEVRPPYREEVTQDKPITAKKVLDQGQQEARPPSRGEVNEPITTEEVLNQVLQEDRAPFRERIMRRGSANFKTSDELKQLYEASLRPKTDEEIAEIKDARARRKEEKSKRKTQKLKQKQEENAYMEQRVNEEVEGPTNKRVGLEEPEGFDEALGFLKPTVDPVARRTDIELQPEVLPPPEEPQRVWSAPRRVVDRSTGREDLKLDVLCQRMFKANFRDIQRSGQF